jgi:4-amino-4-deoxy-L-arabinose transferase-like glycosyltransferase
MHTKTEHPVSAPAFTLSLCAFILLYFLNMRLDVMEVDAAQYASIGMEMLMNGSWLEVYHGGKDYLDKPPLLFWCNATSMAIFGINTFAAKLPGVLALLLSLLSLFRFCQIWYSLSIARLATLVLASSQAFLLMSNDVKTDGLLSAWIMMALWQGSVFLHKNSLKSILLFSLSLALALMTKGPLGFLLPCGALMLHLLLSRSLKRLLNPRLLLVLPIIALLITPMCIGLYEQFDLHPEKEVYGLKGPSGLRFFFWTQSFGRITGEIYWNNGAPWHFFLLSMLWDFAPWVLFFWLAVIRLLRKTEERKALPEYMSLSLFALGMLGMSASQYKLPHYIFPLFGSCAVITANFLQQQFLQQAIRASMKTLAMLFVLVPLLAYILIFPATIPAWCFSIVGLCAVCYFAFALKQELTSLFLALACFGTVLSLWFYPSLLRYQSSSLAGQYIRQHGTAQQRLYHHSVHGHALNFYAQKISKETDGDIREGDWLYTTGSHGDSLLSGGGWTLKADLPNFSISRLTGKFLFAKDKDSLCERRYLMQKGR